MNIAISHKADVLLQALEAHGHSAYVVGGCVRDALLGRTPNDWDICTSARPEETKTIMEAAGYAVFETGIKHGTVTVHVDHEPFEITTYRSDGTYSDGRHPDAVTFVEDVEGDLLRRDFTINAMAYNPRLGLVDIAGGQEDLLRDTLRCVGDPHTRFSEDGLRIMRALRFAATFGFSIDEATSKALHADKDLLNNIARERISTELMKLICGAGMAQILLDYADVIAAVIPQLEPMMGLQQRNPHHIYDVWEHCVRAAEFVQPDPTLRLACLVHDVGKPQCLRIDERGVGHFKGHPVAGEPLAKEICRSLKLPNKQTATICALVRYHDRHLPKTPKGMRRLIFKLGPQLCPLLFQVIEADLRAHSTLDMKGNLAALQTAKELYAQTIQQMDAFQVRDLAIGGTDLMELGVAKGPELGACLNKLLALVVDGELHNNREDLLKYAASHLTNAN